MIRLADIPRTPQPGQPVLQSAPSLERSLLSGASLSRAASSLRMGPVDGSGFVAGAGALASLGRAVREASGVPADIAERMGQAQTAADLARADVIMRDAMAAHQERMAALPEDRWVESWQKDALPSARAEIEKLKLSPATRAALAPDLIRWEGATSVQIRTQAAKQRIQNGIAAIDNSVQRAVLDGDLEGAFANIDNGQRSGLLSQEMADARRNGVHKMFIEQAKTEHREGLVAAINRDPDVMMPDLQAAAKGEPHSLGELQPTEAMRLLSMAENQSKNLRAGLQHELHNAILTGDIMDVETLRERASGKLDAVMLQGLERAMGQEIEYSPEVVSKIRTELENYDPTQDQSMQEYARIVNDIATKVPQRLQGALASEMNQVWNSFVNENKKRGPRAAFVGALFSEIDGMTNRGMFGEFTNKKKEVDDMARLAAWNKAEGVKDAMKDWLSRNRDSTREDAINFFKGLIDPDMQESAREAIRQRLSPEPSAEFDWFAPAAPGLPDKRPPASIRHNNPGAMWFVANSYQEKYGAKFGQRLADGHQIAEFPTPVHGAAAYLHLLSNYGATTVGAAIDKWSGKNNVSAYLATLRKAGFESTERLPSILADKRRAVAFARAMARHEAGRDFPLSVEQWNEAYDMWQEVRRK